MTNANHKRLMIPGPVEVRQEILEAQTAWMIGHRSSEIATLIENLEAKLQQVFLTESRVFIQGSSGTGLWEGASRNCIRDDKKALHLVGGAFSERWAKVSEANGKQIDVIEVEWGQAHQPEMVEAALKNETYDAICIVHNETSTGVLNPLKDIAEIAARYPETLLLVDTVSSAVGAELRVDDWNIDLTVTSSQKAFALPPGLAFATISERVLKRAEQISNRGYYFDFLTIAKSLKKFNTPSTPPIPVMFAADMQLDDILREGLENRWARHEQLRDITHQWALDRGFGLFAQEGFRSPTVTAIDNRQRQIDVFDMAKAMAEQGYVMDKGYGSIKGDTFRIAHMGDISVTTLEEVLSCLDDYLGV